VVSSPTCPLSFNSVWISTEKSWRTGYGFSLEKPASDQSLGAVLPSHRPEIVFPNRPLLLVGKEESIRIEMGLCGLKFWLRGDYCLPFRTSCRRIRFPDFPIAPKGYRTRGNMSDLNVQTDYWNGVADVKTFSHPVPIGVFHELLPPAARILDYGCGYGRTCATLIDAGYRNVVGIDISEEMVKRGRCLRGNLDLRIFDGKSAEFDDCSFDACLLIAVLTCVPTDAGQEHILGEIHRLIRPGGVLLVSDYPLQSDERNRKRYREFEEELGTFGMFRTEGAVVRHHDMNRIYQLLSSFNILREEKIRVCTMNGHEADVFQIVGRMREGHFS